MKFSVRQEDLSKTLSILSRIVSSKPTLPILSNVLIEVSSGKVKLSTTDLDIGITTWIAADAEAEGKVTVSARTFSEFITSLPKGKIEVELTGNQLNVKANGNSALFNIIPADDFPQLTEVSGKPVISFSAAEFKESIEQVVFSAAIDDARPALTGVQFESAGKNLALVGVDGFRLSKKVLKLKKSLDDFSPLVPAKALLEFSKVISDTDTDDVVEVYFMKDKNQVVFRHNEYDLVTRLVDAKFPDYKQIIPQDHKTRVILNKEVLQNSVKIINIFARNVIGNKSIVNVIPDENKLSIQANLAEVGENQSEFEVDAKGDSLVVAFSARYLNDMLNSMNSEHLVFESNGPTMPGVFFPSDESGVVDESYLHIIMPMRIE